MRDYTVNGTQIDGNFGVPTEFLRCPCCGRKYTACKQVCIACEECKRCCTCKQPSIVKVDFAFLKKMSENA